MAKQGAKAAVPRLRFPEFWTMAAWREVPLERVAQRTSTKNSDGHVTRVLTNSAEFGVLDQRDYFDKDIATAGKVDGYYVVGKGDYVYNPRTSAIAPVGPISRNNVGEGVMSPLYTVFRFSEDKTDFYEHYFRSSGWHSYLRSAASTGARHDRMSITTSAFMRMPVPVPSREEQQKIADCLTSLDEVIAAQGRKVEALKAHKRGLMQQLFPREGETRPRLRFPEFRDAPEWRVESLARLGHFLSPLSGKTASDFDCGEAKFIPYSNVFEHAFIDAAALRAVNVSAGERQNRVRKGDVFFTVSSETPADAGMSSVLLEDIADCYLNSFCALFRFSEMIDVDSVFAGYFLRSPPVRAYLASNAQGAIRYNISRSVFQELQLLLPSFGEQRRIADCLASVDSLITAESNQLAALKTHKQGLMQQLFPAPEAAGA